MRRYGPALVLALCAGALLRISLFSTLYLRYVQPGLRPYLIASGVLLLVLGVVSALAAAGAHPHPDEHEHGDGHGHDHRDGPRVAWLLVVPALALLLFPPPALGSYSAERDAAARYEAQGIGTFPDLPKGDPVEITLSEFTSRALYDSSRTMEGRTLRMTGFVTKDDSTWYLTRLLISCCAADARPDKVEIHGTHAPAVDSWVTVTGTWVPNGEPGSDQAWPPVLSATEVKQVEQPENPYEKR
ncbi:TIGR03943 family putative permease subunit [Streptomyces davaonensis]|uniref:TIGR03943 family putative permease subunit n=1 Tax=Streptomyces davaonensis TaxID=348043 RepID=UPI000344ECEE|nr:TIGR03943 family protein [Streptomyces davaonensis]